MTDCLKDLSAAAQRRYGEAMEVAQYEDVATPHDGLVLFTVSFLDDKSNKHRALRYVAECTRPASTLNHTPAGEALGQLQLFEHLPSKWAYRPWFVASRRLISTATGNVTVFVEGAHPRGTFARVELAQVLINCAIPSVNEVDKMDWVMGEMPTICPRLSSPILTRGASIQRLAGSGPVP